MIAIRPHARGGGLARCWRRFRHWRRSRPFWGGLFTLVSGVWIFGTTQLSLGGLSIQMGPTGFLSWLIPTILAACGLLMWFTPNYRMFYAIVAAVTAVYSLIGVNLGGFFIGMLFGLVGAALGFAWVPAPVTPARSGERAATGDAGEAGADVDAEAGQGSGGEHAQAGTTIDDLMGGAPGSGQGRPAGGPVSDILPAPYNPLARGAGADGGPGGDERGGGRLPASQVPAPAPPPEVPGTGPAPDARQRGPRLFGVALLVGGLAAAGALAAGRPVPAYADPCPIVKPQAPAATSDPTSPNKPDPKPTTAAPKPAPGTPTPTGTPTVTPPAEEEDTNPVGEFVSGVVDGFKDLLGVGEEEPAAAPAPTTTTTAAPAGKQTAKPAAKPTPTRAKPVRRAPAPPAPDSMADLKPCTAEDLRQPGPVTMVDAPADLPLVARPSRLTGSLVKMHGLAYNGVAELRMAGDTTIRALEFTMSSSVTTDFELRVSGPGSEIISLKSTELTVAGNVRFYASRFHGKLLGIPLTFTPDFPPPITVPEMEFGDPDIQLVYVDCDTLIADNLDTTLP